MPIAITCSGCQAAYSLADDRAGKKLRCKKCGQILVVCAGRRPRGEEAEARSRFPVRDEEAPPRTHEDRRDSATADGERTIHRAVGVAMLIWCSVELLIGLFLLGAGIYVVYSVTAAGWAKSGNWLGGSKGVLFAFLGGVAVLHVALLLWAHFSLLLRKERFIIGKRKLEWVVRKDELLGRLPYDNIGALRLKKVKPAEDEHGPPNYIIGIGLIDPRRKDTFIDKRVRKLEEEGFDFAIWDEYDVPLKAFYERLKRAWLAVTSPSAVGRETAEPEDREEEAPSPLSTKEGRPRRKGRIIGLVPLLVIGPLFVLGLIVGPFVKVVPGLLAFVSFAVFITAIVISFRLLKQKGHKQEYDAMEGEALWGLIFSYALLYPRRHASWFGLAILSLIVMGVAVFMAKVAPPEGGPTAPVAQGVNPGQAGPPPGVAGPEVPRMTGDPETDKLLADLGEVKQPIRRMEAANRLAQMKPNDHRAVVARKLAEVAGGTNEFGRGPAVKALVVWATPNELPVLLQCFRSNPLLRDHASRAIRNLGPAAEKDMLDLLKERDSGLRGAIIDVLRDIGTGQSIPALQAILDSNDPFNSRSARAAIAAIQARASP